VTDFLKVSDDVQNQDNEYTFPQNLKLHTRISRDQENESTASSVGGWCRAVGPEH
jgi:hypothetical protein